MHQNHDKLLPLLDHQPEKFKILFFNLFSFCTLNDRILEFFDDFIQTLIFSDAVSINKFCKFKQWNHFEIKFEILDFSVFPVTE